MEPTNGGAWDDAIYLQLKQELHEPSNDSIMLDLQTSESSTLANPPHEEHPELAPYHDEDYVYSLLTSDICCFQKVALGCCHCIGAPGYYFCALCGSASAIWWTYNAVLIYDDEVNFELQQFLIYLGTGLTGLFLYVASIYILSMDTHKILSFLLASFGQKLDLLNYVTSKLETTREKLHNTEENLTNQTNHLRTLVSRHEQLVDENRTLHSEHNELANKYQKLIREYDSAIVEQQKILSSTLMAVAELHQHGSEQIHDLLKEMSQATNDSKEVCRDFGRSFLQVDKLKTELTDLRNGLNTSISDLHLATKKNHDLADKLTTLTSMLPQLLSNQNTVNRRHIMHERKAEDLTHLLRGMVGDSSDKPRATTLPNQGSTERKLLEMSLPPLKAREKPSQQKRRYRIMNTARSISKSSHNSTSPRSVANLKHTPLHALDDKTKLHLPSRYY